MRTLCSSVRRSRSVFQASSTPLCVRKAPQHRQASYHLLVAALAVAAVWLAAAPAIAGTDLFTLPGKLDVDARGEAHYSIPIAVPPGTAGMAPVLSLEYASDSGNGLLGMGWSLTGLPAISRCGQTIVQDGARGGVNYDSNDRFCLEGERLIALNGGTYGADGTEYRTEINAFSKVVSHGSAGNGPAWFQVWTKSGQIMEFGNTADSQILAQNGQTARVWAVDKISDTAGNYLTVTYTNDKANGQYYPTEIDYTGNDGASLTPYNSVKFVYGSRGDTATIYEGGSAQNMTMLLTNVQTFAGGTLVSDYRLAYQAGTSTTHSELTSVTRCGGDGSCLAPTTLTWQGGAGTVALTAGASPGWGGYELIPGDWTGDGRTGLLVHGTAAGSSSTLYVADENGNLTSTGFSVTGWDAYTVITGDWNGDGKTDIALIAKTSGGQSHFYISTGSGFQDMGFDPSWGGDTVIAGDWDGDGRTDVLVVPQGTTGTSYFYQSTGTTFAQMPNYPTPTNWAGHNVYAGDWDGDGKTDIAVLGVNLGDPATFYRSTGSGIVQTSTLNIGGKSWDGYVLVTGDFNGDGRTDFFLHNVKYANFNSYLFLSDGAGGFWYSGFAPTWGNQGLIAGDWNGDGKTDLLVLPPQSSGTATFYVSTGTSMVSPGLTEAWGGDTVVVGDWNGEGAAQPWTVSSSGSTEFFTSFTPERLVSINNGLGATTTITYDRLTKSAVYSKDANATYPTIDLRWPGYVVTRVDASNGVGGTYSSTYAYAGGKFDLQGRGFLGFRQITVTDLQTNIAQTTNYDQTFPYIGLIDSKTKALSGTTLDQTANTYQFANNSGAATVSTPSATSAPYAVSLQQSVDSSWDLDGSAIPAITTAYQYDSYGNATQVTVSTPDGASKTTQNTYTNDTTNWLLGRLTGTTVTSTLP